jgi:hypothetical protein
MALHAEYYELIWQGLKTHEFRRRFLEGRAVRWFVYLNAPVSRLTAVIDLAPAEAGSPDEIAGIAERMRPGNAAGLRPAGAASEDDGRVREGGGGGPDPVDYGASSVIPVLLRASAAGLGGGCR